MKNGQGKKSKDESNDVGGGGGATALPHPAFFSYYKKEQNNINKQTPFCSSELDVPVMEKVQPLNAPFSS